MMLKLRKLMLSMLVAVSMTAMADEYAYLNVSQSDGGEASFTVSQINKITFDNTNMIVSLTDGSTQQLPLSGLSKMFFSASSTGIDQLATGKSQIRLTDGTLHVNAPVGSVVTLYNIKGQSVKTVTAQGDNTEINLSGLVKGVYIVKVGQESKKIMNK